MLGEHGVTAHDLAELELVSARGSVITQDQLTVEHLVLEKKKNSNFATLRIARLEKIFVQNNVVIYLKVYKVRENIKSKLG